MSKIKFSDDITSTLKYKIKRRFKIVRILNKGSIHSFMVGLVVWELNDSSGLPARKGYHYTFYLGKYGLDFQFYKEYTLYSTQEAI